VHFTAQTLHGWDIILNLYDILLTIIKKGLQMKTILFSAVLGLSLFFLAGCGEEQKQETTDTSAMKCEAGKCGEGKCGDQ
jgi:hypothetical protein